MSPPQRYVTTATAYRNKVLQQEIVTGYDGSMFTTCTFT
jgi:hypothetical protein